MLTTLLVHPISCSDRAWTLGEQMIHVGDLDAIKTLMKAEHELVERKAILSDCKAT